MSPLRRMARRTARRTARRQAGAAPPSQPATESPVTDAPAAPAAPAEPAYMAELEQLNQLKEQGILSEEEYAAKKPRFSAYRREAGAGSRPSHSRGPGPERRHVAVRRSALRA